MRFGADLIVSRPLIHPSGGLEAHESGASTVYRTCPAVLCVSTVESCCSIKSSMNRRMLTPNSARNRPTMSYTIALVYERKQDYLAKGFSEEECAELEENETIDALTSALESLGHTVVQVGDIKDLVACLAKSSHQSWDLVFSTSEGIHGLAREAQVPALLEAYEIPFIGSDAASTVLCHDKAKTKV